MCYKHGHKFTYARIKERSHCADFNETRKNNTDVCGNLLGETSSKTKVKLIKYRRKSIYALKYDINFIKTIFIKITLAQRQCT